MSNQELSLQEIQHEMLNVVLKIDELCRLLNIRYCLAYGSLIGAIRHNGFIPWDDDMDVWMTKKDLDIFTEYCLSHEEELKPFKLCSRRNVKNYSYYIPRFANFDFKYVNTDPHQAQFDIGVFVDIYPIEGYGNTDAEAETIRKKCNIEATLYDIYVNPNGKSWYKNIFKKVIFYGIHVLFPHNYWLIQENRLNNYLSSYPQLTCKYVGCVRWDTRSSVKFKREDVFDESGQLLITKHTFAGTLLNIPSNYDAILKAEYGDYMQLPPEEKRNATHYYRMYRR